MIAASPPDGPCRRFAMSQPALTLSSLPLFPLGAVLFPGGVLTLRVFEVRYLDMVRKCHLAGAPFGVVTLTQGHEVRRPEGVAEAFHPVGTLATIARLDAARPGLLVAQCDGTQRFRVTDSGQLKHGLWVATVQRQTDDQTVRVPDDLKPIAHALGQLLANLQRRAAEAAAGKQPVDEAPVRTPWQLDDCGWVANRWCEMLPLPLELRHRLMALDNPLVRLELVGDVLARTGIA